MNRTVGTGPEPGTRPRPVETERLVLRLPTSDDGEQIFALAHGSPGHPVTSQLLWDGPDSVADCKAWCEQHAASDFYDVGHHWAITAREDANAHLMIGIIALRPQGQPGRSDLGYWLGEKYWGYGVMTDAVMGVVDHAFENLNMQRIEASVFVSNPASSAVLDKVGFRNEGTRRGSAYKHGQWVDEILWAIRRSDWDA